MSDKGLDYAQSDKPTPETHHRNNAYQTTELSAHHTSFPKRKRHVAQEPQTEINTATPVPLSTASLRRLSQKLSGNNAWASPKHSGTETQASAKVEITDEIAEKVESSAKIAPQTEVNRIEEPSVTVAKPKPVKKLEQTIPKAASDEAEVVTRDVQIVSPKPESAESAEEEFQYEESKTHPFGWTLLVLVAISLILVGAAVSGYITYYHNRALPGTMVGNTKVSGMTAAQIRELLDQKKSFQLKYHGAVDGKSSLSDMGIAIDEDAVINNVFKRNLHWRTLIFGIFSSKEIPVSVQVDYPKLYSHVAGLVTPNITLKPPVFPQIKLKEDGSALYATGDQPGKGINPKEFLSATEAYLNGTGNGIIETRIEDITPFRTKADLAGIVAKANEFYQTPVAIKYDGQEFFPTPEEKLGWIVLPAIEAPSLTNPVLNDERIKAWVKDQAQKITEQKQDGVRIVNSGGEVLRVERPAKDGRIVTNTDAVAQGLIASLNSHVMFNETFRTKPDTASWIEKIEVYNEGKLIYTAGVNEKWIDVNLTTLRTSAFVGNNLQIGPIPSLAGKPGYDTPTGVFKVWYKVPMEDMRGHEHDGTPYLQKNVKWAVYFHLGYAIHGAYWHDEFGNRKYGGSHGCINMPDQEAELFYNFAEIGTIVVVHY